MKFCLIVTVLFCCQGCPLWFVRNDTANECQCGEDLIGIIKCERIAEMLLYDIQRGDGTNCGWFLLADMWKEIV